MALSRRTGQRFQASIWPGFVDAMTGLLLVLMFVLTIFMVVQFALRETITGQESELDSLSAEVAALSRALGLEQDRSATLQERVGALTATLTDARQRQQEQTALIASLSAQNEASEARIASFEQQVAGLLAGRDAATARIDDLEGARDRLMSEKEALQLALADLRSEVDAGAEAARLAAAQRDALEALAAELRAKAEGAQATASDLEAKLSDEEAARLAEAAAAEALREKLQNSQTELTAMTLALEEQRRRAEETLTLLAAARDGAEDLEARLADALAGREDETAALGAELDNAERRVAALEAELAALKADQQLSMQDVRAQLAAALAAKLEAENAAETQMSAAEERAALLSEARRNLAEQTAQTEAAQRDRELLNQQVAALRDQLGQLQALLDESKEREAASDVRVEALGQDLNAALARVAAEEKRRRQAEEEKNKLLEAEKQDLEKYRSEFFGRLRDVLGTQDGVRIEGDRFVFSSEVLFAPGQATLSAPGKNEIAKVAEILRKVVGEIPEGIDWIIRVDGHTDDVPIRGTAEFADNWELSQARALSVVRYMIDFLGVPPGRLAANGFGQYQPIAPGSSPEARAQNRRIELKFTEK
ncbi:peptidoglycan -binding protein [Pelagivirga sediminicola]|uniref:Peptidoglycan-binding protein n=1 Tax=Pelagivirga sediminicola TaxID=2170575 RepID=A0A2T7G621_9RHOB|nr:peptidoglycan -binding protein [Pelagivirga sediminicola]PVA09889.1 peptidoglycan -binding protein [Pelagivirga sediminicola]